jgi:uncharacterized protein
MARSCPLMEKDGIRYRGSNQLDGRGGEELGQIRVGRAERFQFVVGIDAEENVSPGAEHLTRRTILRNRRPALVSGIGGRGGDYRAGPLPSALQARKCKARLLRYPSPEVSTHMQPYSSQPQPAWIDGQTIEGQLRERAMFRSVFGWMFVGLLLTAASSLWVVTSPAMQQLVFGNPFAIWILFLAEIGLVLNLSARLNRISPTAAAASFLIFSLLNGLSLSVIAFVYTRTSIAEAFGVGAGMFGAMALYGAVTKRDLTSWGSFFFMGLIGILLIGVVNFFLHSPALAFAFSAIGVLVFVGLTAYDAQTIKRMATASGPMRENFAIIGALRLYLDFINLSLMLLRLFGRRR